MFYSYFSTFIHSATLQSSRGKLAITLPDIFRLRASWIALVTLMTTLSASVSFAQERKVPVDIKIILNKSIPITGNEVQVTLEVTPLVSLKSAKAYFTTTDKISLQGQQEFSLGQLNKNTKKTFTTKATLSSNGRGILTGAFKLVTEEGYTLGTSRSIYFLINKGNTFYGEGSFVTAQSDSIKYKLKSARLSPESYEQEYKKALKKAINGNGPTSINNLPIKSIDKKSDGAKIAASVTFTLSGIIKWSARDGSTHPVKLAPVEIWDNKSNKKLADATTDATGSYNTSVTADNPDIYIKTFSKSPYFFVVPQGNRADETMTYFDTSPIVSNVSSSTTISRTIPNNLNNLPEAKYSAFSIYAALIESSEYIKSLSGSPLARIPVEFPGDANNPNASYYSTANNFLSILAGDRYDWDVLHHEYGHYVQLKFTIADLSASDTHGPNDNLADRYSNKPKGFKLAWNEAWPTYFGISLQQSRSLIIPGVGSGNTDYEDTEDASLTWNIESSPPYPSIGEDNEIAVQRVLWDLYDGVNTGEKDEISLGDATVWQIVTNQHPQLLSDIWGPVTAGKPMSEVVKYGAIFAEHKVASLPTAPASGTMLTTLKDPVTFKWDANGAGPSYKNNKFTVEFYSKDFSKLLFTSAEQNTPEFTATESDLKTIFATESEVKWIVKSSNQSAPVTGPYTSPAFTLKGKAEGVDVTFIIDDTGSMSEEIGGVRNWLTNYLNKFDEKSGKTFRLVTFKDNVSPRAPTTNLQEIKNQVAALFASGGDDCPEASVEALDAVKGDIKDSGVVIIATDAAPHAGLNIAGITASLATRGVTVSTLLSGDCSSASTGPVVSRDGRTLSPPPFSDNRDGSSTAAPAVGSGLSNPTAIEAFSYIAQETKGIFAYVPEVNGSNANDKKRYENIGFNILVGATSASVAFIEPYRGPAGSTLTTTITGVNTNFNASSSIVFDGTGISVGTITVLSPTKIEATISIPAGTALGLKDITITTALAGGGSEVAQGVGLLEVTPAPSTPTIVSIAPPSGSKGQSLTVLVAGINTNFTDRSTLNLGSGITVSSVKAINATQLLAEIRIAADATAGYRNVVVTTGAEVATENVIGPFLVIEAGCTPINVTSTTIPSGGTAMLTASGCSGSLLWSTGATTSTIMVGPLTESTTVSATCTTGSCVVSATGTITVTSPPVGGGSLTLLAPTYNCATGAFTFNTSGGDGSPVSFSAIGITGPTTNPNQFVDTELRTAADAPPIVLNATQNGVTVTYIWNIRAVCPLTPPPVGGDALTLLAPTYNCTTGAFTFITSGGDGSPVSFSAIGITGPTTNPNQFVDVALRTAADAPLIILNATQSGVTVTYTWNIRAVCPLTPPVGGDALTLLAPTYNCATGAFTFNTSGGNGSTVEYRAVPGITDWTTNPNQFVDEGSRTANDVQPFLLQARQNGVETTLVWDLKAACGRARLGIAESKASMTVSLLGNPVAGETVEVEVSGVEQQPLQLQLSNLQGQLVSERHINQAATIERVRLQLSQSVGVYLLQVSSPGQIKVVRVIKVN